jgi:hypothetical protein
MLRELPVSGRSGACRLSRPWSSGVCLSWLSGAVGSWSRGAVWVRARAPRAWLRRTELPGTELAGAGLRCRVTAGLPGTRRAAPRRSLSWPHGSIFHRARIVPAPCAVPPQRAARRTGLRLAIPGARLRAGTIPSRALLARGVVAPTVLAGTELVRPELLRSLLAGAELARSRRSLRRSRPSPLLVWSPPLSSRVLRSWRLRARAVHGLAGGLRAVRDSSLALLPLALLLRSLRTGPLLLAGTVARTRTVLAARSVLPTRAVLGVRPVVGARCLRASGLRTRTVLAVRSLRTRSLRTRSVPARCLRARRARSPRSRLLRANSERTAAELRSRGRVGSITRRASAPPWPARRGARAADAGRRVVGELPGTAHRVLGCLPRGTRRHGPVWTGPRRAEWNVRGARFSAEPRVTGIDWVCLRLQIGPLRLWISVG